MLYSTLLTITYICLLTLWITSKKTIFVNSYCLTRVNRNQLYVCFLLLFIIHAFKDYKTFADLPNYVEGYNEVRFSSYTKLIKDSIVSFKCEKGFAIFMKLISEFSTSPLFLMVTTSVIILTGYYFLIKRYSLNIWFSVLILLTGPFIQSLYVIRQYAAISICLLSVPYIINRKFVPYLILVALAFSFHQTAIVFFPLYFLYGINSKKILSLIMLGISTILIIGFQVLSHYFVNILSGYESFLDKENISSWHMTAVLASLLLIRIFVLRMNFFENGIERLLSLALILAIAIAIGGSSLAMIGRVNIVFTALGCLYIPSTLLCIKNRPIRIVAAFIYIIVFSYVSFSWLSSPSIENAYTYWTL